MILITPSVGCPDQELDEQLVPQMLSWGGGSGRLTADRHPPKGETEPLGELRGSLGESPALELGDVQNVAVAQEDGRPVTFNRAPEYVGHDRRCVGVPDNGSDLLRDILGGALLHADDGVWRHHLQGKGVPEEHLPLDSNAEDKLLGIGLLGEGFIPSPFVARELATASLRAEENVIQCVEALFDGVRHG